MLDPLLQKENKNTSKRKTFSLIAVAVLAAVAGLTYVGLSERTTETKFLTTLYG